MYSISILHFGICRPVLIKRTSLGIFFVGCWFQWPFNYQSLLSSNSCLLGASEIPVDPTEVPEMWKGPEFWGCVGSPFAKAPRMPMSPGGERGSGSWGVHNLSLCCSPILGSLNSPPFSFPTSLCLLLIFRFYSCY